MASRVRVVMPISGSEIELDMELESTVADLKRAIAGSALAVPPLCQRIHDSASSEELGDSVPLSGDVYVLIRSMEALRWELEHGDVDGRLEALDAVCEIASKGGIEVLQGAASCLEDGSASVRRAAAHALTSLAKLNDRRAVAGAIAERLTHPERAVRRLAVQVCEEVMEPGDSEALRAFVARLDDRDFEVQRSAISALGRIAQQENRSAILDMLKTQITSGGWRARSAALTALGWRARSASLMALGAVATPGDGEAIAVAVDALPAACHDATCAALRALAQLAGRGHQQAVAGMAACLDHEDAGVRWVAVTALAEVAEQDDGEALEAVLGRLEDEDSFVREAAVKAVARILPADRRCCLPALNACLSDESGMVAEAAAEALKVSDKEGDGSTQAAVAALHQKVRAVPY